MKNFGLFLVGVVVIVTLSASYLIGYTNGLNEGYETAVDDNVYRTYRILHWQEWDNSGLWCKTMYEIKGYKLVKDEVAP